MAFALVRESDDTGRQAVAFVVGNCLDLASLHDCHDGVGRSEVDPNDFFFSHRYSPFVEEEKGKNYPTESQGPGACGFPSRPAPFSTSNSSNCMGRLLVIAG